MTQVNLVYRRPDGANPEGTLLTVNDGSVLISAVRRFQTSDGEMTTVAFPASLGATVVIDPGTWTFELIGVSNGKGGYLTGSDAKTNRVVPASGGPYDVDDLEEVDVSGSGLAPEWKTYIDAAIAGVSAGAPGGSGPGGAFVAVDVTDTTSTGRAVMKATDGAAARTAIGAGTSSLVIGTGAGNAAAGTTTATATAAAAAAAAAQSTASGAVTSLAGKASQTDMTAVQAALDALVAPDWGDIEDKPNVAILDGSNQLALANMPQYAVIRIGNGGVTVPIRPAYAGSVEMYTSTEPPRTGTTAGGTAALAPGDIWLQAP